MEKTVKILNATFVGALLSLSACAPRVEDKKNLPLPNQNPQQSTSPGTGSASPGNSLAPYSTDRLPENPVPNTTSRPQVTTPESSVPTSSVVRVGRLKIKGAKELLSFTINNGRSVTLYDMHFMWRTISRTDYDLSSVDQVIDKSPTQEWRNEFFSNNGRVVGSAKYGVIYNDRDGIRRFDFSTRTFSLLIPRQRVVGLPYVDERTGHIWQFNSKGTVKMNQQTIQMPPLQGLSLSGAAEDNRLRSIKFDPNARVLLWHGFDCNTYDCLNASPSSKAVIWDLNQRRSFGPFVLRGASENYLGWTADVLPSQREFMLLGNEDRCLKLRAFSYSGAERNLPTINSLLGTVCDVRDYLVGYGKIALRRLGDQGLIVMAFNDQVVIADTKADKILEKIKLNIEYGEPGERYRGVFERILVDEHDPQVFGIGLNITKYSSGVEKKGYQLHLFRFLPRSE